MLKSYVDTLLRLKYNPNFVDFTVKVYDFDFARDTDFKTNFRI